MTLLLFSSSPLDATPLAVEWPADVNVLPTLTSSSVAYATADANLLPSLTPDADAEWSADVGVTGSPLTAALDVETNCPNQGYDVIAVFNPSHSADGRATVYRIVDGVEIPVRGFEDIDVSVVGSHLGICDVDVPLDGPVSYRLEHTWTGGSDAVTTVAPSFVTCNAGEFVARSLIDADKPLLVDVCVGRLENVGTTIRSGVFQVIGRASPIVTTDVAAADSSTLHFIAHDKAERREMEELLATGDPILVQAKQDYDVGPGGVIYAQPQKVVEVRLGNDGRRPERRFDVDYVEISPPPGSVLYDPERNTYDELDDSYAAYSDMSASGNAYYAILYDPLP